MQNSQRPRASALIVAARKNSVPAPGATLWPQRRRPGLSRNAFFTALAHAHRKANQPPEEAARVVKPGAFSFIEAFTKMASLVGMPEMYAPDAKGSALLRFDQVNGRNTARLTFRRPHSKDIVAKAGELFEEALQALGEKVQFREVLHEPNMSGWSAVLRLAAPAPGRGFALAR